jgi:DNA-directed RNA polymerase specialized sigma24 family protein
MSFGQLKEEYEMSQKDVAKELHLDIKTIRTAEREGIEKIKKALAERGIELKDLLEIYK